MASLKKTIFKFTGTASSTALNLEQVQTIILDQKRITFSYGSHALNVDLETEEQAAIVFDQLCNSWGGEVVQ